MVECVADTTPVPVLVPFTFEAVPLPVTDGEGVVEYDEGWEPVGLLSVPTPLPVTVAVTGEVFEEE